MRVKKPTLDNLTATFGEVDLDGCTPVEQKLTGGISHISDYSVTHKDNWVARANAKQRVVTRRKHG